MGFTAHPVLSVAALTSVSVCVRMAYSADRGYLGPPTCVCLLFAAKVKVYSYLCLIRNTCPVHASLTVKATALGVPPPVQNAQGPRRSQVRKLID